MLQNSLELYPFGVSLEKLQEGFQGWMAALAGVLQLTNNYIDLKGDVDCSQTSGSCPCCSQGHSLVPRLGFDNCSSTASSLQGHKFERKSSGTLQEAVLESTTGSEDHCTCNKYASISCSHSVSSAGSSILYDDEAAVDLQTPVLNQEVNHQKDFQLSQGNASRVEELQLDLLECALEYEVKILEMKMKMVQMRSTSEDPAVGLKIDQGSQQTSPQQPELPAMSGRLEKMLAQRLDTCRKKMNRLQDQRDSLTKELVDFRKKQRKFELQRRNMDDLMRRVNNLQRKLVKKDEEMVECQLKEKEAKARLHELQVALQRSKAKNYEPEQLVKLIPSLRTWLRSLKKTAPIKGNHRQLLQVEQFEAVLGRIMENAPRELLKKEGQVGNRNVLSTIQSPRNIQSPRLEHSTPVDCIREVYELQKELQRLAMGR
ncbi:hypothetical protein GOP47_0030119 [Adiantum capillus-veneris]|nr:hypothetical protein GOP47_0030119 [Adiantum capillus-veneris]